ncbi:MAG: hypothetical protein ACOYBS_00245 [Flavobacterium sp.]
MKNLNLKITLFLFVSFVFSCKKETPCETKIKFDKVRWLKNDSSNCFRDREKMIYDLLNNHKIKGLKYSELSKLLGGTEIISTSHSKHIIYDITTKNDSTIDLKNYKELIISLSNDSVAIGIMVALHDK